MEGLNQQEQRELQSRIEKKQMKDFMNARIQMYTNLVQRCFNDCVNDFTSKSLLGAEEGCVMRCVDKFMKGSERVGERFQEQNQTMMQQGGLGSMGR